MSKPGRNDPCVCGSGKKYKHCHYGKPFMPELEMTVHQRNRVLLGAAYDIFGFRKGRNWQEFKQKISGQEIREFYSVQARLCKPTLDWITIMPKPTGGLTGLYLGEISPELILRNLIRFSLYSDQLFVVNPVHNPWILKPEFNPIENPDQFKADTIRVLYFLFQISPWIESGIVQLIPDPGDFNWDLKRKTFQLATARRAGEAPHERDLEEARLEGQKELARALYALPDDRLLHVIEQSGQKLTEQEKRDLLDYARRQLQEDPLALAQPITDGNGQLRAFRAGANLETALLISQATGAFLYTNMAGKWEEIISARDQMGETARVWSPFASAFQSLKFRFLDDVDVKFANNIREHGRLETFRSFLRKIGKDTTDISDLGSLEAYVRDCKDELIGEYNKAQAEWSKIDEDCLKWASSAAAAAAAAAVGHLLPNIAALSAGFVTAIGQLGIRYLKQEQFRRTNPMSVFIDLSRKDRPGVVLV
jgi:hypothetical protein